MRSRKSLLLSKFKTFTRTLFLAMSRCIMYYLVFTYLAIKLMNIYIMIMDNIFHYLKFILLMLLNY